MYEREITISTGPAEIKHVILPDSTEIILNAESWVTYSSIYQYRVVWVDGNVYIKVKPDGTNFTMRHDSISLITKDAEFYYDNAEGKSGIGYGTYSNQPEPAKMGVVKGTLYAQTNFISNTWQAGNAGTITNYISMPFYLDKINEQITWIKGYYSYKYINFGVLCRLISRTYNVKMQFDRFDKDALIDSVYLDINQPRSYLALDSALNSKLAISTINDSTFFAKPH